MTYFYKSVVSPVGELTLVAGDQGLAALLWPNDPLPRARLSPLLENGTHPILVETERQLAEYFAGKLKRFSIPLDLAGTAFQKKVWAALRTIPFGDTRSYAQIAAQIGRPTSTRAVGAANGKNPIPLIVPCHRVIGSNGTLTGFSGGLSVKTFLLRLESPPKKSVLPMPPPMNDNREYVLGAR